MENEVRTLVTGAGGFIGDHLVSSLKQRGYWVRAVDRKHPEFTPVDADEFQIRDLRHWDECLQATAGIDYYIQTGGISGATGNLIMHVECPEVPCVPTGQGGGCCIASDGLPVAGRTAAPARGIELVRYGLIDHA